MTSTIDPGLPLIYISYAYEDQHWCDFVSKHLKGSLRNMAQIWNEAYFEYGKKGKEKKAHLIDVARVAIILVSPDYLASDYIHSEELPRLLERGKSGGLSLIVLPVRPTYLEASELNLFQFALSSEGSLSTLGDNEKDAALIEVIKLVNISLVRNTARQNAMPVSMSIELLELRNFKNFRHELIHFHNPADSEAFNNVTLILGQNSSGKTSILRAICLSVLAEILPGSGYVPRFLVREEKDIGEAQLTAKLLIENKSLTAQARIHRSKGLSHQGTDPGLDALFDEASPEFLLVGYGSSRWVPLPGPYDAPSQRDKVRLLRYQRVASLFEDNFGLMPIEAWLSAGVFGNKQYSGSVLAEVLNELLRPTGLHFDLRTMRFEKEGIALPLDTLADGYRYYISWLSDLLYHMARILPQPMDLSMIKSLKGIVLVDEIDLHLHASWQRVVIETISKTFPNLQFIFTTHSPLVAGSLPSKQILVMQQNPDGTSKVARLDQNIEGLDADQILLTPYFGLETTRSGSFSRELKALYDQAAEGDRDARLKILQLHAIGVEDPS